MSLAVGGKVRTKIVRAAANLGIAAVEQSLSIKCFSARQIGFLFTATDADSIAAATIQVGNDDINWNTVDPATMSVDDIGTVTGVALNGGGRWLMLVPNGLQSTGRIVFCNPWVYARCNFTGGAAQTDGLKIDAYVWDEIDFAMIGRGDPPAVVS